MTERGDTHDELEEALTAHLRQQAARAPAPRDLWERVRSRLGTPVRESGFFGWLGRWLRPVPAFAVAGVLVVAVGATALLVAAPLARGTLDSFAAGSDPTPTPVPPGFDGPAGASGAAAESDRRFGRITIATDTPSPRPPAAPTPTPAPLGAFESASLSTVGDSVTVQFLNDREVASAGSLSIEVASVRVAMAELRAIAESLGGFVEQLTTSGGPEPAQGTATIRVPGDSFFTAVERIQALGEVQSERLGQEDVTGRAIDLDAQLRGELRKEESLLELLDRANSVSDVLTVERELSRVRSTVERLAGQLAFLERRVALASIVVSLSLPPEKAALPSSAIIEVQVEDVGAAVRDVLAAVSQAGGEAGRSVVTVRNGSEEATLSLRVPEAEFDRVLDAIEAKGTVQFKQVQRSGFGAALDAAGEEVEASFELTLSHEPPAGFNWWVWVGVPAGAAGAALLLGALLYAAYRAGRRAG